MKEIEEKHESQSRPSLRELGVLWRFGRPYRKWLIGAGLALLAAVGLEMAGPLLVRHAIDHEISGHDTWGLFLVGTGYLGCQLLLALTRYIQVAWLMGTGQRVVMDMKEGLFRHLLALSQAFFDHNPPGKLVARVESDTETLENFFGSVLIEGISNIFKCLGMMAVLFWVDGRLALLVLPAIPLLVGLGLVFQRWVTPAFEKIRAKAAEIGSYLGEYLRGMSLIQAFGVEQPFTARMGKLNHEKFTISFRAESLMLAFYSSTTVAEAVTLALVIWWGGGRAMQGITTLGTLVLFITYVRLLYAPILDLSERFNALQKALVSGQRLGELFHKESEVKLPADPVAWDGLRQGVEFRHVSFGYGEGPEVLHDVSFTLRQGERLALVGSTGCGKSTILRLLYRFYDPRSGEILVDGIPLRSLDLSHYRRRLGLVLQDVVLFPGTLRENLSLYDAAVPEYRLEEALRRVAGSRLLRSFPGGWAGQVSERGANLSMGERQLLSFGRAILPDPDLLCLDEATSSIDPATEQEIQRLMRELSRGRTLVTIAHRLATVKEADRLLVLEAGRLVGEGRHEVLLRSCPVYRDHISLQEAASSRGAERVLPFGPLRECAGNAPADAAPIGAEVWYGR